MKISKVTVTGADDSTHQLSMFYLSEKYPFVEWGILLSRSGSGLNRFPSRDWLSMLYNRIEEIQKPIQLSGHLCGSFVRELLMGNIAFINEIGHIWEKFQRIQINTHGVKHDFNASEMCACLKQFNKEIIFQYDNVNSGFLDAALLQSLNCSTLFDLSHGGGVLAKEWPLPIVKVRCGYAGGLSPVNVEQQVDIIFDNLKNAGLDVDIWIDMETHVRSKNNSVFDLAKVMRVLQACKKFV